jgi:hypothetical protein
LITQADLSGSLFSKKLAEIPWIAVQSAMKMQAWLSLVAAGSLALSSTVFGQTMTMTGKVLSVTSKMITVQTATGVWEITRASDVKVTGNLKVGATVTINYSAPDAQKKEGPA